MSEWLTEARRGRIYRISLAAGVVAMSFGVLTQDKTLAITGLVAAVLNVMPTKHTSTKR